MNAPATKLEPATYEDLLGLPDHLIGEILDGELHASPRPAIPHAYSASNLGADINSHFRRGGSGGDNIQGWWILYEPELHLGGNVLVPDLAGWKKERLPKLPLDAFFTIAPDWVCEVISTRTAQIDRVKKNQIYAREKIPFYWIIDPMAQTVEAFRLEKGRWLEIFTGGGNQKARIEPFTAVELDLSGWWIPV